MSSFLERAVKRGIGRAVGSAVEKKAAEIVTPYATRTVNKATENLTEAANAVNTANAQSAPAQADPASLNSALFSFQSAVQGYANEAAKNMQICPQCGEAAALDKKFCPSCGAKLPGQSVAQSAVCPACGCQNDVGTKFCSDCGARLPEQSAPQTVPVCPTCGRQNDAGTKFCAGCGTRLIP